MRAVLLWRAGCGHLSSPARGGPTAASRRAGDHPPRGLTVRSDAPGSRSALGGPGEERGAGVDQLRQERQPKAEVEVEVVVAQAGAVYCVVPTPTATAVSAEEKPHAPRRRNSDHPGSGPEPLPTGSFRRRDAWEQAPGRRR